MEESLTLLPHTGEEERRRGGEEEEEEKTLTAVLTIRLPGTNQECPLRTARALSSLQNSKENHTHTHTQATSVILL